MYNKKAFKLFEDLPVCCMEDFSKYFEVITVVWSYYKELVDGSRVMQSMVDKIWSYNTIFKDASETLSEKN